MNTNSVLTLEKRHQDSLWILHVHTDTTDAVDAWEKTVRTYIEQRQDNQRYLVYDVGSVTNFHFTTYLQSRASVLAQTNKDATGRVAIVVNANPTVTYLMSAFVSISSRRTQPHLSVKLFNRLADAIVWVEELLPSAP